MKILKFVSIKLFILILVNLFVFAISFILMQILKSMENPNLAFIINSFISGVVFWCYLFVTTKRLKNPDGLTKTQFVLRETLVYSVLILFIAICMINMEINFFKYIFIFFLPNTFFFYLTDSALFGGLLHIVWFLLITTISRLDYKTRKGSN